jgi:ribokinase
MHDINIAVLGSLNYDCTVWGPRLPSPGETVLSGRFGMQVGGKGANQAVQAALLGAHVHMIGCVGQDFMGDEQFRSLAAAGVDTTCLARVEGLTTGACCIHVDSRGENAIMIVPGANQAITAAMLEAAQPAIESARVFITQLEVNLDAVVDGLRMARQAGCLTILDPAPMQPVPEEIWSLVDLVKPNETEAAYFTGIEQGDMPLEQWAAAMSAKLRQMGPSRVIVTLGSHGAWYDDGQDAFMTQPFAVQAVDATAAGDSFSGALAVALAEGKTPREAVRFACAAGAVTALGSGAQQSLRGRCEIEAMMSGGTCHGNG